MIEIANDWVEKYKPKKISDIIGNSKEITELIGWLENYEKEKENFLNDRNKKKEKKGKKKKEIENDIEISEMSEKGEKNDECIGFDDIDDIEGINEIVDFEDLVPSKQKNSNKKYSSAMIIGNHGIGKTCIVNAILNEKKYNVEFVNMCNLASNKNISEKVNKLIKGVNIFDSFDIKNMNKKKIIIIDEIETISTQIEKKFIEYLLKINEENWYLPIIFISSLKHSKLITILKKNTFTIWLKSPTINELGILLRQILKSEKLKINKINHENTIMSILNYSQNDYRRLIFILYDLYKTFNNKPLTVSDVEEYCEYSKKKDTDIEIYKCTNELMLNYQTMQECYRLYSGEKVIIPLMIHQNYPKILLKSKKSIGQTIKLAYDIAESISMGDMIENYIYSEQNWDMQDVHCYYTCINPSYKLTSLKIQTPLEYMKYELEFPKDLNRTSIKNINRRNVMKANIYLSNMDINDFMNANALSKMLIEDKKIEECVNLYKSYGAKSDTIISVLKIDKINIDKSQGQQNTKKIFNKFL
jgi:hypothetical protein